MVSGEGIPTKTVQARRTSMSESPNLETISTTIPVGETLDTKPGLNPGTYRCILYWWLRTMWVAETRSEANAAEKVRVDLHDSESPEP